MYMYSSFSLPPTLPTSPSPHLTLHWIDLPLDFNDWAVAIVTGEEGGVDGGRHEDDSEVRVHPNHVSQYHQNEVRLREGEEGRERERGGGGGGGRGRGREGERERGGEGE